MTEPRRLDIWNFKLYLLLDITLKVFVVKLIIVFLKFDSNMQEKQDYIDNHRLKFYKNFIWIGDLKVTWLSYLGVPHCLGLINSGDVVYTRCLRKILIIFYIKLVTLRFRIELNLGKSRWLILRKVYAKYF